MAKYEDISGQRFGRLLVLRRATEEEITRKNKKIVHLVVQCECGIVKVVEKTRLKLGETVSCGCWARDIHKKHGQTGTATWNCWAGIKKRCNDRNNVAYARYGGRGICLAPEWEDFSQFLKDVGERPSDAHSLDRTDNDGNYEPGNVQWVLDTAQARNKRNNRYLTHNGVTKLLIEWAEEIGINYHTLINRIDTYGWSAEDALTRPVSRG